jgi:predicted N-acetyltransferase YhbS
MLEGPVACRPEDLPSLIEMANRVFRGGGEGDMGREYPLVFDEANLEHLRIFRDGSRVVSHVGLCIRDASILGHGLRVVSVGAVSTDPGYRGRGMATALMEDSVAHARSLGCSLMLISGGRGLYRRMGAVDAPVFERYTVKADATPSVSGAYRMGEAGPDDLAALACLYQAEPVRFHRSVDDWAKLLRAGMLMNHPMDLFVAWQNADLVAYACVQKPDAGSDSPVPRVLEYAGSRAAIRLMLPWIARRYRAEQVVLVAMPADASLPTILRSEGVAPERQGFAGTIRLIDVPAFFQAIAGYLEERLGGSVPEVDAAEDRVTFRRGADAVTWDGPAQVTSMVFTGLPEDANQSAVQRALRGAFPLPLLWYGLNYV